MDADRKRAYRGRAGSNVLNNPILRQQHEIFIVSPTQHWWTRAILGGLIYLTMLGAMAERDAAVLAADRAAVSVSTAGCPPPAPGLTDTVVMVIKSQADLKPAVTGCNRIRMRSFSRSPGQ